MTKVITRTASTSSAHGQKVVFHFALFFQHFNWSDLEVILEYTGAQTKYALKYYNFINTGSSSSFNNINDWAKLFLVYWVSSSMTRIKAWKTVVELYILWSGGCPGFVSVQVLHRFSKTRSLFDSWKGSRLLRLTATRNLPLHCCSCLQQFKPRFFKSGTY